MTCLAPVVPLRQIQTRQRARPLLSVMAWEARRMRASRSTWIIALLVLALFLLVMWSNQGESTIAEFQEAPLFQPPLIVNLTYASPWRLMFDLPRDFLFLLAIILPFVCAEGVAYDWRRRTHELLMTTALPTWAYIWGRYLVVLLLSLGLAVELLAAILMMGQALHLLVGGETYPAPQVGPTVAFWAAMVLPTILLISSASFILGTLLPRRANLIKIGIAAIWLIGTEILPKTPALMRSHILAWYTNWDPTSGILSYEATPYGNAFFSGVNSISETALKTGHTPINDQVQRLFNVLEYQIPDLWSWLGPHLVWAALGLACVALTAISFKRFRNVWN